MNKENPGSHDPGFSLCLNIRILPQLQKVIQKIGEGGAVIIGRGCEEDAMKVVEG